MDQDSEILLPLHRTSWQHTTRFLITDADFRSSGILFLIIERLAPELFFLTDTYFDFSGINSVVISVRNVLQLIRSVDS